MGRPEASIPGSLADGADAARLLPIVYDELRAIARAYFRKEAPGQTLQPTALVHEAYVKLMGSGLDHFHGRAHFMALASAAMRQILIDRARRNRSGKHGGGRCRVALNAEVTEAESRDVDVLALNEALCRLADFDPRKSKVVELRFFAGMSLEETAEALNVARSTVAADWRVARAWMLKELKSERAT